MGGISAQEEGQVRNRARGAQNPRGGSRRAAASIPKTFPNLSGLKRELEGKGLAAGWAHPKEAVPTHDTLNGEELSKFSWCL